MRQEIVVKKAVTRQDFARAVQLQTEVYRESGYLPKHKPPHKPVFPKKVNTGVDEIVYLTGLQDTAFPTEQLIGTISLTIGAVSTCCAALRSFPIYFQRLCSEKRKFLYIGSLAILPRYRPHRGVVMSLIQATMDEAVEKRAERVLCVVHPKHLSFYTKCLGFIEIDQCKNMPGLINAPAILLEAAVSEVCRRLARLTKRADCLLC